MLIDGLLQEVSDLLCQGVLTADCMGAKAIGYKQVSQSLDEHIIIVCFLVGRLLSIV